jgi:hypothetical protein
MTKEQKKKERLSRIVEMVEKDNLSKTQLLNISKSNYEWLRRNKYIDEVWKPKESIAARMDEIYQEIAYLDLFLMYQISHRHIEWLNKHRSEKNKVKMHLEWRRAEFERLAMQRASKFYSFEHLMKEDPDTAIRIKNLGVKMKVDYRDASPKEQMSEIMGIIEGIGKKKKKKKEPIRNEVVVNDKETLDKLAEVLKDNIMTTYARIDGESHFYVLGKPESIIDDICDRDKS